MGLSELRADAQLVIERLSKLPAASFDAKAELTDNILPLLIGITEAIQEGLEAEVADLADAVDELIDQTGDVLHPETAQKIVAVLEVGQMMSLELEALLKSGKVDDVKKKKIATMIHAYRQGAKIVGEIVVEITMLDEPDDPDQDVVDVDVGPGVVQPGDDDDDEEDDDDELAGEGR